MPGYVIHLATGKEYIKNNREDIQDVNKFLNGIIIPDILSKPESHYGKDTATPDLDAYLKSHPTLDDFNKGYFLHLITDYLFYNKFLKIPEFLPEIYDDYDKSNKLLIEKYKIDIPEEIKSVVQFKDGDLKILDFKSICEFIETIGKMNIPELLKSYKHHNIYKSIEGTYEK